MFFELPYLWHTPWYAGPDFRHLMPVSTSLGVVYFLVIDALCCPPTALEIPVRCHYGHRQYPDLYFILRKKMCW